jgi:hypothetical protein
LEIVVRVRIVVGVVLCLAGLVWILQGTNLLHGSGMSGHGEWAVYGAILFVVGALVLGWAWRLRNHRST